jgi:hypothetical protein
MAPPSPPTSPPSTHSALVPSSTLSAPTPPPSPRDSPPPSFSGPVLEDLHVQLDEFTVKEEPPRPEPHFCSTGRRAPHARLLLALGTETRSRFSRTWYSLSVKTLTTSAFAWSTLANAQRNWKLCWRSCFDPCKHRTWTLLHQGALFWLYHHRWTMQATWPSLGMWESEPRMMILAGCTTDHDSRTRTVRERPGVYMHVFLFLAPSVFMLVRGQLFFRILLNIYPYGWSNRFPYGAIQT